MLTYIIDDDSVSLFLTEQVLKLEGLVTAVRSFTSAEDALACLLRHLTTPPQLILLDLNMDVVDGWGFLAELEPYQAALQGCCIYFLTSSLAPADITKARGYAYVAGIIHKPLNEYDVQAIRAQLLTNAAK
jgi:CheY-like chemotaxis protein